MNHFAESGFLYKQKLPQAGYKMNQIILFYHRGKKHITAEQLLYC